VPKKKESYEDMMAKLEDIVNNMDGDKLTLDESMKKYEEGIKLCSKIYKLLKEAEGKVSVLTAEGEKDFDFKG
jgi:exodeoxyribonuclease VII small subunit